MRWEIRDKIIKNKSCTAEVVLEKLLLQRKLITKKQVSDFLNPKNPKLMTCRDVGISKKSLQLAIARIKKAILTKESVVVYADYDADGITAGAILWETLHRLGANVMPYIPHRIEEGYGLSVKGIDHVFNNYKASLLITVDHGITAWEKVEYAKKLGIDVIITDHHVKPKKTPKTNIVHTTKLSGAGVSWFLAHSLIQEIDNHNLFSKNDQEELVALAAIGTIADMVPLLGPNRRIAYFGLSQLNKTTRIGLKALFHIMRVKVGSISSYEVSFMLAPRLNAMGRLVHALDALRLLLTPNYKRAQELAQLLNQTNTDRQLLTQDHLRLARKIVDDGTDLNKKILIVIHESFNQGVIGLVAGKLVEMYYRPVVVISISGEIGKASARSIPGFSIIKAIRSLEDLLVDAGGHPMAAGFTVEKNQISKLCHKLESMAEVQISKNDLVKKIYIDLEILPDLITVDLIDQLNKLAPFGVGNNRPIFALRGVVVKNVRLIGRESKHIKMIVTKGNCQFEAIGFHMGSLFDKLVASAVVDIVFNIDDNFYQGTHKLQLVLKDIRIN